MKTAIKLRMSYKRIIFVLALILSSVFMLSMEASAQHRDRERGREGNRNMPRHFAVRTVRPPQTYARISVSGRNYFYRERAFYRKDRAGFHVMVAPIGARVRALPLGYLMFRFGPLDYYYYNGIYYNYLPDERVYVVVQKPDNADNPENLKLDQVKLYDGSVLNGVFQSATDSTVTLRMSDQDRVINIGDIISINFASSISDSTNQK